MHQPRRANLVRRRARAERGPLLFPVQEGTRTRVNIAPSRFNGTRTFNTITYITAVANHSDIMFPFSRSYGLEYLDFLANSTPVGQNVTVTTGGLFKFRVRGRGVQSRSNPTQPSRLWHTYA